ncbi:hypothetical protein AB3N61_16115 [Leptospira sp. WS58.C1]|uniref:hypothetical protein n=1 Tax=Leptospira TaxID=171 RepID=UPI0002BDE6A0|nr:MULTISPECIES: hypothetical protein [Leptospira]EMK00319.1 hypothetical protein LEP1GSC192_2411 [Leptospira sp. B5-022]MCR1792999.1 hypothetical protein [Leptospira sp. id769339]
MSQNGDHYNKAGFWTFVVVLAANILYFVYLSAFHKGVKDYNEVVPSNTSAAAK